MSKVTIPQGVLKGGRAETDNGFEYYEFLGVPYAKPPVGELRFKSPQPPEPWKDERDASTINESNVSCQIDFMTRNFVGSEDCLYLNVYTPKLLTSTDEVFPVMVFIHGGGYAVKNGIIKNDGGPDFLIENNVVIVTINYRLSVFGFLSLDIPEVAGNMGLKDQVKALEWVKQNIGYFNGDCNNVTIFGSSAGAASVEYLLLSPKAKELFHKAIIQSGSVLNTWTLNKEPKKSVETLLKNLDYKGSMNDKHEIYNFLMEVSAEDLIIANTKPYNDSKKFICGFVPIIENNYNNDEAFLINKPQQILSEGTFNKVPILKGFCNKEASLRIMMGSNAVRELPISKNFVEYFSFDFHSDDYEIYNSKLLKAYFDNKSENEINEAALDFLSDLDFVSGIWISGKIMANSGVPLYIYEFSYVGDMNLSKIFGINVNGAGHTDESSYLFSSQLTGNFNTSDNMMRNRMTKLWTDFAKTSNPTPASNDLISMQWPLFTDKSTVYLNIDKELKLKSDYEPEKMAIFEEILNKYFF